MNSKLKVYAVGYSNSGVTDWMSVQARDAHGAAGVACQEGAELVLWVEGRRHGLQVFRAMILIEGRVLREAIHMSEAGARTWVRRELERLQASFAA